MQMYTQEPEIQKNERKEIGSCNCKFCNHFPYNNTQMIIIILHYFQLYAIILGLKSLFRDHEFATS